MAQPPQVVRYNAMEPESIIVTSCGFTLADLKAANALLALSVSHSPLEAYRKCAGSENASSGLSTISALSSDSEGEVENSAVAMVAKSTRPGVFAKHRASSADTTTNNHNKRADYVPLHIPLPEKHRQLPSVSMDFPDFGAGGLNDPWTTPASSSRDDWGLLDKISLLNKELALQQQQVEKYRKTVFEVTELNERLYNFVGELTRRVEKLELHDAGTPSDTGDAEKKNQAKPKQLEIDTSRAYQYVGNLPTPILTAGISTSTASSFPPTPGIPRTPMTPGSGHKPSMTVGKKVVHDLTSNLPPPYTEMPMTPLTDEELIVFFFNATSRPIVALRLYSRGWAPNRITEVLNKHRDVKPSGYHRNTCSVRCTTAIRRGIEAHGTEWEQDMARFFKAADDLAATEALRLDKDEKVYGCDFPVLRFQNDSLTKYPEGKSKGIFTDCVQWILDNNKNIMLSQVHIVAAALRNGSDLTEALAHHTEAFQDTHDTHQSKQHEPIPASPERTVSYGDEQLGFGSTPSFTTTTS